MLSAKKRQPYWILFFAVGWISMESTAAGSGIAKTMWLPRVFGDNMVLQRKRKNPVWGKTEPGSTVTVELGGRRVATVAGPDSVWSVRLPEFAAGGPFTLRVIGKDTVTFNNVLFGEVWIGSGQSNMEMPLAGWGKVLNYEQEIRDANDNKLRLFHVRRAMNTVPRSDVQTDGWQECSPASVAEFSSTAYFFGRELRKALGVPVGLIASSWGGTPAESWVSGNELKTLPDFAQRILELETQAPIMDQQRRDFEMRSREWKQIIRSLDAGYRALPSWDRAEVEDGGWGTMHLPVLWESAGFPGLDGVVWFRKSFDIPATWMGKDLVLNLGTIDDTDTTWFNGVNVGSVEQWNLDRRYTIPASLVRSGRNTISVRVMDTGGGGGLYGSPNQLALSNALGDSISLSGEWRVSLGVDLKQAPALPLSPDQPDRPAVLFNGMIHPLVPYGIRGVIWYQGESNAGRAKQYRTLFPALIRDWRRQWNQGDFPFLFVQLANYMEATPDPGESDWAELREAQLLALGLPKTGMAVTIDIGDARDIHPKNKQEVGRRLALAALKIAYKQKPVFSGPIYRSMKVENGCIRLFFDHAQGLSTRHGGQPKGFALAGENGTFVWAEARIEGKTVVVFSSAVPEPKAVRYAWASNPECNLVNAAGLPASPFRTDTRPGITQ
ncbi:MAG TPA: sialate O-acetylesterase [bacterium]